MKKVLSLIFVISILLSLFTIRISAEEPYRVLYKNEEITDIEGLSRLYHYRKNASQAPVVGNMAAALSDQPDGEDTKIMVDQILECRQYKDGHTEYEAVVTGISAVEDGVLLSSETLLDNIVKGAYKGAVAVSFTGKFVFYIYSGDIYFKFISVSTKLNNKGSSDVVNIFQRMNVQYDFGATLVVDKYDTYNAVRIGDTNTIYDNGTSKYIPVNRYLATVNSGCLVYINCAASDKNSPAMEIMLTQNDYADYIFAKYCS